MKIHIYLLLLLTLFSCKKDPCKDINCQNAGTCNENGFCECATGYEGLQCEIAASKKFIGNYGALYDCVSAENVVAVETQPGANPLSVTVRNLGDYICPDGDYLISAICKHDTLFIENQQVCISSGTPSGYVFNGFGKLKGDTLKMTYSVFYSGSQTDNCQAILVKE